MHLNFKELGAKIEEDSLLTTLDLLDMEPKLTSLLMEVLRNLVLAKDGKYSMTFLDGGEKDSKLDQLISIIVDGEKLKLLNLMDIKMPI